MSGHIIDIAWLVGIIATWRSFTLSVLKGMESAFHEIDGSDRFIAMIAGTAMALVWPASLLLRAAYRLVSRRSLLRTPSERAAADKAELEALRRLAREHGLPMPGDQR